ncbi:deoxyuridine 5' [Dinothrombium tinctorium]|uniref:dUTP diphosphatase n=1 Tax=Dinothrombium tinctorium TaxID=1965070 RepID=A0A3S3PKV6_9ACAR|nr:deoxyuridine 5' [Dinothrombium tinctorium]
MVFKVAFDENIGVILINSNNKEFFVSKSDRIAQLICERCEVAVPVELEMTPEEAQRFLEISRGANGFGSTGLK